MSLLSVVGLAKGRTRGVGGTAWVVLVSTGVALALVPATAGAVTVGPFALSPQGPGTAATNTQAGTDADLVSNTITFGGYANSADTLKDLSVQLAPGLLVNPSTIPSADLCTSEMLTAATPSCPPGSQIGTGTLTANVGALAGQMLNTAFYLMAPPTPADAAGVGMIVSAGPVALLGVPGSADINPNGTLQVSFANLPQSAPVAGVSQPIQITGVQLTINGTVKPDGSTQVPFTRLPTSCGPATSTLRADAYSAPSAVQAQSSAFTPTGCGALVYAPQFSAATGTLDSADPGVALTTTFTQGAGAMDSALSSVSLMLPFSALAPNAGTLIIAACAAPLTAACQPVGTATVTTPLLGAPLNGKLYAVRSGGLPGLSIVLPPPVAVELDGVTSVGSVGELVETFTRIPDLPISALTVAIPSSGTNSLFTAGPSLCAASAPTVGATFTPQDGGGAVVSSVPVTRVNCPPAVVFGAPTPILSLPHQVVRLAGGQTGRLVARCTGAKCAGALTLTVNLARRTGHGKRTRTRYVPVTVASGTFSLAPGNGGSSKITVKLTRLGRQLLKRHARLKASATARYSKQFVHTHVTLKVKTVTKR